MALNDRELDFLSRLLSNPLLVVSLAAMGIVAFSLYVVLEAIR